ncbi:MAG: cysteine desulfurase [Ignavibacteria bacterium]|nr:cysteine desulfurase [Ignavibacteria bacterium]
MNRIYLDNAATTKTDEDVLNEMIPFFAEYFGNASSLHSFGKKAKVILEDSRDFIAEFFGADSKNIIFTNSGTESNNHAIKGTAFKNLGSGKDHIISSSVEHSSVLDTLKYLESRFNFNVTYIKPDRFGRIDPAEVLNSVTDKTFLISLMHSNNETGAVTDIKSITKELADKNICFHSDTVQSAGKSQLNFKDMKVNFTTVSAHKIYGPKGIAALYIKDKTLTDKLLHGGKQERDLRGGTENIPLIAGFKKAVELLKTNMEKDISYYEKLKLLLTNGLTEYYSDGIIFNSDTINCLPNIVNISFDRKKLEFDEEMLLIQLDLKGIAVSGGSACTAGTLKPSHVLRQIGHDEKTALGSLRISIGRNNSEKDIVLFMNALKEIVKNK